MNHLNENTLFTLDDFCEFHKSSICLKGFRFEDEILDKFIEWQARKRVVDCIYENIQTLNYKSELITYNSCSKRYCFDKRIRAEILPLTRKEAHEMLLSVCFAKNFFYANSNH
jgi:hypothetical protein